MHRLLTFGKLDEISKVIAAIDIDTLTGAPDFITYLASLIQDQSLDLSGQLHEKLVETGIVPSTLCFNYLIQSAAHFKNYPRLVQLLFEATLVDTPLDLNTYLKILSQIYFDYDVVQFDRKDFITYLYTLFSNDHTLEDF